MTSLVPIAKPFLQDEEVEAVSEVLRSRWVAQGPKVAEFERAFAKYVGAAEAVATSSCTTALHLTLSALGIGVGDEVVCPSLSFIATANAVKCTGARPVFAEVDARTLNMTPDAAAQVIGSRTKAILVVHQVGLPADLDEFIDLARAKSVHLVEDAACAVGATYRGVSIGRPHGVAACFSFHPRKVITTGEGGMITTADASLADRLRRLRNHGALQVEEPYSEVGWNYRMTDMQAAMGLVQLGRLPEMLMRRKNLAARYTSAFVGLANVDPPPVLADRDHAYQSYVLRLRGAQRRGRAGVMKSLADVGIQTRPGVMAAHVQPVYAASGENLPVTEALAEETVALPLYHELSELDQERVIAEFVRALEP
jgi:dTDP-4-amino-4,6-dideoxygalactose transaminase